MDLQSGQVLELLDAERRMLGRLTVEDQEDSLLTGHFAPGPSFAAVEPLFRDFEEAANAQAFRALDRIDAAITALGLRLRLPDAEHPIPITDVQIWSDGGMTCRLGAAAKTTNGDVQTAPVVERGREP
jgi:hypothetical protein